jgi:hypothetical protein
VLTFHCCRFLERYLGWQHFKRYGSEKYWLCPKCYTLYSLILNPSRLREKLNRVALGKNITSKNFVGHYVSWCTRNSIAPLHYDILVDIFTGCESNIDYEETLNALYTIQDQGIQVSFMTDKTSKEAMRIRLRIRLELFRRVPTATNMVLAYNLIEEIILKNVQEGSSDISDEMNKMIDRFDKLKNLALGTKYINERKLAFDRSVQVFEKMVK